MPISRKRRNKDEENERVAIARRKADAVRDMPPLSSEKTLEDSSFKKEGTADDRAKVAARIMREVGLTK